MTINFILKWIWKIIIFFHFFFHIFRKYENFLNNPKLCSFTKLFPIFTIPGFIFLSLQSPVSLTAAGQSDCQDRSFIGNHHNMKSLGTGRVKTVFQEISPLRTRFQEQKVWPFVDRYYKHCWWIVLETTHSSSELCLSCFRALWNCFLYSVLCLWYSVLCQMRLY